jgi:AraC family ethanolamine operon transcriptional activator
MNETPPPARADSNAFWRLETHDFDELAEAVVGMETDLRQLSGGPFCGGVEIVALGPVQLMWVVVNRAVQVRGATGAGVTLFSPITPACEEARWRRRLRKRGEINFNRPASEIDHLTGQRYDSLTIIADTGRLLAAGEALLGADVSLLLRKWSAYRPTAQNFAALEACANAVLRRARTGSLGSEAGRAGQGEALLEKLLDTLADERAIREGGRAANRRRVACRAEEFMLGNLRRPLLMTRLCKEVGVSERTLRYAFRDCFGVSPLAYFKVLKLNEVRRHYAEMRDGDSVQEIAREWGVMQLGNFAADYRQLFGERPSETARQRRRSPGGRV